MDTDHELAQKLRGMTKLNKVGTLTTKVAAGRLEQRADMVRVIAEVFGFHYYRDKMNAVTHLDEVRFSPLTVMLAETLRNDETSDAPVNYGAVNEVMGWADSLPVAS